MLSTSNLNIVSFFFLSSTSIAVLKHHPLLFTTTVWVLNTMNIPSNERAARFVRTSQVYTVTYHSTHSYVADVRWLKGAYTRSSTISTERNTAGIPDDKPSLALCDALSYRNRRYLPGSNSCRLKPLPSETSKFLGWRMASKQDLYQSVSVSENTLDKHFHGR